MKYDYDLICIGLGPAGMAVSIMGSEMGLKVCSIEKNKIGGECMNVGCIPSKAILRVAQNRARASAVFKVAGGVLPQFHGLDKAIFDKIQTDIKYINEKKTLGMFDKVDLILGQGEAEFVDPHTVKVGDRQVTARRIFIATGTEPAIPPIEGIETVDYLTNNTMFHLEAIPKSLTIIGGGAIGCEMAQAFARLGCKCTIIQMDPYLLPAGDSEAGELLQSVFEQEGISVHNSKTIARAAVRDGHVELTTPDGLTIISEKLLIAAGRRIPVESLKLEKAGVQCGSKGIAVNRNLRTSQPNIYAVGDCNGYYLLSHAAMHQGMLALMNCMMPGFLRFKFENFMVPWTVFTEPEVSCVGLNEGQLKERGIAYETITVRYEDYGAAIAEHAGQGFVKVFASALGRIYGVCIVGEGSGEMINEWALAIQKRARMHDIMFLQHSFPTMGFLSKRVAETWMMGKMKSPMLKNLCRFFFRFG